MGRTSLGVAVCFSHLPGVRSNQAVSRQATFNRFDVWKRRILACSSLLCRPFGLRVALSASGDAHCWGALTFPIEFGTLRFEPFVPADEPDNEWQL
jgi:hypothetical protein